MSTGKPKIKVGAKFGKLTIIAFAEWHNEILLVCSCKCFRIVRLSEAELKSRTACLECEAKKEIQKFSPGDIVIYVNSIGELAYGEQAIVSRIIENQIEIEYRGHAYICRPNDLEKLGVNFYGKRRRRKFRQFTKSF